MFGNFKIATLTKDQVDKIRDLEGKIHKHIMAFEPGISIAKLSEGELKQLEDLEVELGVVLLAYKEVEN